jgi:predicted Kef-type K+ transport protein
MEAIIILLAFVAGLLFRKIGYPPLLGYLCAGFAAYSLDLGDLTLITAIADIGILLLLFTIGLKLNLKELAAPQVWAVACSHTIIAVVLTVPVIILAGYLFPTLALENATAAWSLAFALSFSSTVFAVKIFDERGENASLHAIIAIGILVVQDIFAVLYLVSTAEKDVSASAVILLALPLLRPVLLYILRMAGHGELLILFGILMALGAAELFEVFNLKGGLGALIFGVLLGSTKKSNELYKSLISLKDLFLIGFFLQIGYYGLPSPTMVLAAVALALVLFVRPLLYHFLLILFRIRARTAFLAGISLFNYSEFGLIVASIAVTNGVIPEQWLTTLALSMSLSFFISTPFNVRVHSIFAKYHDWLHRYERAEHLSQDEINDCGTSQFVVLGMGRVGKGVYEYLREQYGDNIVGVEENYEKSLELQEQGYNSVSGDATDYEFWAKTDLSNIKLICVSLTNHHENISVVNLLQQIGYKNKLAVISRFPDEKRELEALGCIAFDLYAEAGHGFAEHVLNEIKL